MVAPQSPKTRRVRPSPLLAEVARVQRLTPHRTRVGFTGQELSSFNMRGPAAHFKVNFPLLEEGRHLSPRQRPRPGRGTG